MNLLTASLILVWGVSIITTVFIIAYIDSYDCSQFENGWDKVCLDNNELYKEHILRTATIAVIVLSALLIILRPNETEETK